MAKTTASSDFFQSLRQATHLVTFSDHQGKARHILKYVILLFIPKSGQSNPSTDFLFLMHDDVNNIIRCYRTSV